MNQPLYAMAALTEDTFFNLMYKATNTTTTNGNRYRLLRKGRRMRKRERFIQQMFDNDYKPEEIKKVFPKMSIAQITKIINS